MSKNKGGLGLRYIDAANEAFQCKLAWNVLTNNNGLWTQAMKAKYVQNNINFFTYKSKTTDSPIWKSIIKIRKLMRTGINWEVGKGDTIFFWYDNWIENKPFIDILNMMDGNIDDLLIKGNNFFLETEPGTSLICPRRFKITPSSKR